MKEKSFETKIHQANTKPLEEGMFTKKEYIACIGFPQGSSMMDK